MNLDWDDVMILQSPHSTVWQGETVPLFPRSEIGLAQQMYPIKNVCTTKSQ